MKDALDVFVARAVHANRGDLASQAGIVYGLLREPTIRNVYVSSYYPHHYANMPRVRSVAPPPVRGFLTNSGERPLLRRRMPIFWGGGVDLQDTGSKIKMPLILLRILLLKRCGSPFVMAFQGAGPVRTRFGRLCLRCIARRLNLAVCREPTAQRVLTEQGRLDAQRVRLATDGALLLDPPNKAFGRRYLADRGLDPAGLILGLNLRRWFHQKSGWLPTQIHRQRRTGELNGPMRALVENIVDTLQDAADLGYRQIVLLPMYRSEPEPWEDDIALLKAVRARLVDHMRFVLVHEDLSVVQLASVFSCLTVMIGVRLHSTILAHVAGVPAIHVFYEHKGPEHFARLGMSDLLVGIDEACGSNGGRAILAALNRVHNRLEQTRTQLAQRVQELRNCAQSHLADALHVIHRAQ